MAANRYEPPTEDEFVQEIKARAANIPNCKMTHRTVLKAGPQTYKSATILQFTRPDTDDVSHRELRLDSYSFRVASGLDFSEENRRARWNCRDSEIEQLRVFLENYEGASEPGTHKVVRGDMAAAFNQFLSVLGKKELRTSQLLGLIGALADRASDLRNLPELGEAGKLRMAAAAIRVAHRTNALVKLRKLIDEKSVEPGFQTLLEQNWWMLGSHYVDESEEDVAAKHEALRTYNSHLHRIEVVTYDHLARIAENVITSNAGESGQEDEDAIQGPVSASDGEIPL